MIKLAKILTFTSILLLLSFRIYTVNKHYHGYIYHEISSEDFPVLIDNTEISILDVETKNLEADKSLYLVHINISNSSNEETTIDLSNIVMVKDICCSMFSLEQFYELNNVPSYIFRVKPNHSGEFILPYIYYADTNNYPDIEFKNKNITEIHLRMGYPYLNENYVYRINNE